MKNELSTVTKKLEEEKKESKIYDTAWATGYRIAVSDESHKLEFLKTEWKKEREKLNFTIGKLMAECDNAEDDAHKLKLKIEAATINLEKSNEKLTEVLASRAEVDGLLAAIKTLVNMERDPFNRKLEAIKAICSI